ncbi:MAG: GNAT family N-acetyltransferase, partial [Gemmatimonadota bacterium]|nr:GNAT family N-acetyltransferase [Gemmatimonadota bacterium]
DWTFRLITEPADWTAGWSDVLSIEARSWKHTQRTSIANEPGTSTMYGGVGARAAAAGMLRLHIAMHRGVPVAHVLGVVSRGTFYLLKHSFAEEYKPSSAGTVLMWYAMADAAANGWQRFDFLGDAMEWKVELSTSLPEYHSSTVFPASEVQCLVCRVQERTLKPLARRFGLAQLLRPLRRVVG